MLTFNSLCFQSPTIPTAWGIESEKRSSSGSPIPSTGEIEPAEKRESSDSRLSNDEDSAFVPVDDSKPKQATQIQIFGQDDDEFLSDDEKVMSKYIFFLLSV